jgi:ABC-type glycerol-3-phosphate transport system permease component
MVDLPQNTASENALENRQVVENSGTLRRDTLIGNSVLYVILTLVALVAIAPFYWMLATSMMSLGETIQRQWVPSLTYQEDFATYGVITSSEGAELGLYVPPTTQEDSLEDTAAAQAEDARGIGIPVHVNYVTAWQEANFSKYFMNSVIITGLTIVGLLLHIDSSSLRLCSD